MHSISSAIDLDEDVLQRAVDQAPGGDVERALGLLHGAEDLGDPHPLLGQLELLRPGDVVRPLGGGGDGPDQPLHRLVFARRRRHREHERDSVLRLQLRETNIHAITMLVLKSENRVSWEAQVMCTSLEVPVHRRRPYAAIPIRSHRASASFIECAERLKKAFHA